jgi:hypothetical protein
MSGWLGVVGEPLCHSCGETSLELEVTVASCVEARRMACANCAMVSETERQWLYAMAICEAAGLWEFSDKPIDVHAMTLICLWI